SVATTRRDAGVTTCGRHGLWAVADVRLDDRAALVAQLRARGVLNASSASDVEVVIAAYRTWGLRCPEHLTGDFAFALWDERQRRLLCARDPLGIRAFHFAWSGRRFVFGSEAVQVLAGPSVSRELCEIALADHLANSCRDEERT